MSITRDKNNTFFKSKIVLLVCIIVLIFFIIGLVREIINRRDINNQINSLESQVAELQSQKNQVSELVGSWQDGSHLEKEARLRLGLQKPGEKAIIISRAEDQTASSVASPLATLSGNQTNLAMASNNPESNPVKWIHYFFK